jgi:hypothetical protein
MGIFDPSFSACSVDDNVALPEEHKYRGQKSSTGVGDSTVNERDALI